MNRVILALSVLALGVGCGVSKEQYTTVEGQLKTCEGTLASTNTAKKGCEERLAALSQTKEQLEEKTKTYADLVNSLESEIKDGKVKISEMQGRLTVNLIDKILFDSGRTMVKEEGKVALTKVADVLKGVDDKRIQVEGHTDNVPVGAALQAKFPTNWELSAARATSVVRHLAEVGVPQETLSATGYSKFSPVASNETLEGRRQNRRIEIVLVPKLKEKTKTPPESATTVIKEPVAATEE